MGKLDDMRDDFWDLDRIMPKKKNNMSRFNTSTMVKEHKISGDTIEKHEEQRLTMLDELTKPFEAIEESSYVPERDGLIKRITIKKFRDRYDFYGNFRKAAIVYWDYKTDKCEFAPFYSYMPQYSQLTTQQKQYYFYFRDMVRRGKFIKSDYSYLYLLVYEILNMPDYLKPEEGVILLCKLWREYRNVLPKIDSYFATWIQDYCLIHKLNCPMEYISEFIFDVISASDFKEFYLSEMGVAGDSGTDALIAYLSDYDWRKCRYRTPENKQIYSKHMIGAMDRMFLSIFGNSKILSVCKEVTTIERDAFPHSLCTHAVKCRLAIEYAPLSRDLRIREIVTMGVRYAENKLRAVLGVKSRLAVKNLPEEYKLAIDSYFDAILEKEARKRRAENLPEYEKLYEAPKEKLSFEGADEIERVSWSTTARLVSEDDVALDEKFIKLESEGKAESIVMTLEHSDEDCDPVETYGLEKDEIDIVFNVAEGTVFDGDLSMQEKVDKINECFADGFGDIIIESNGEKYRIIEDYEEDVKAWLLKHRK
jgi:hypothetical protein